MVNEVIDLLVEEKDGIYVDATAGGGGHTAALLACLEPGGRVFAVDRDASALDRVEHRLGAVAPGRCTLLRGNYSALEDLLQREGILKVNGVLMDLGMSSDQLDDPGRGLSFQQDGPLDMRLSQDEETTAADLVNGLAESELERIFREFGEERHARTLAKAIGAARADARIETTAQLAGIVEKRLGRRGPRHPATRVFQALRIAVNREFEHLEKGLAAGLNVLADGGRLAVISFHSLEDRMVKQFMKRHVGRWESLPAGGQAWSGEQPRMERVTRKPLKPGAEEVAQNPRARSAKLRVARRMSDDAGMNPEADRNW